MTVHVGPPKAATTSLQYFLQSLGADRFSYGGVLNPRPRERANLATDLFSAISHGNSEALKKAVESMESILKGGRHLVISEERFLLDAERPHQELVFRLGQALEHLEPVACLTLRDPVEGLQSMYQQFHWRLPPDEQASFERFLNGNQARVYDYLHLEELLHGAGFSIRCMDFKSLVSGDSVLSDLTGDPHHGKVPIHLEHRNVGKRVHSQTRVVGSRKVAAFIRPEKLLGKSASERLRRNRIIRSAWDTLRVLKVRPGKPRDLRIPHDTEKLLRGRMADLSASNPAGQATPDE